LNKHIARFEENLRVWVQSFIESFYRLFIKNDPTG